MNQLAFKMYLKPNTIEEYQKRHDMIWPELKQLLKDTGIGSYHIYHDPETNCLFAFQQTDGRDSQSLGDNPIVKKWWKYMSDLMETNEDHSPIQLDLAEVFSL
ncbi:MAG: L-rhamnose mutarotase [Bacteroidetes bacterium]|jgi:L-rhamnose mutarotase|nr:L-rhamnose mutarotase [Bacteroidota bacterium]